MPQIDVSGAGGGQAVRVADRFKIVALAGELATEYGFTGWDKGAATEAASECYQQWLASRGGGGNTEKRKVLEAVADFIERHGQTRRFPTLSDGSSAYDAQNQAGWRKNDSGCNYLPVHRWRPAGGAAGL